MLSTRYSNNLLLHAELMREICLRMLSMSKQFFSFLAYADHTYVNWKLVYAQHNVENWKSTLSIQKQIFSLRSYAKNTKSLISGPNFSEIEFFYRS